MGRTASAWYLSSGEQKERDRRRGHRAGGYQKIRAALGWTHHHAPPISEKDILDTGSADHAKEAAQKIGDLLRSLTQLQSDETRLQTRRAGLLPWKSLDMPLELEGTTYTRFRLGVCPGSTDIGQVKTELGASGAAAELYEISGDKQ